MAISLIRTLLVIIADILLQPPFAPLPKSSQPSTSLATESGKKRRGSRRKWRGFKGGNIVVAVQEEQEAETPPFPLSSLCAATKRRITEVYHKALRAARAKNIDVKKVREFINCLVDARNELLHKSEIAQRSFMIKKALLANPCSRRGSYDRLFEQVNKLEAEHKRLKDDADIYDNLQEQLQMSPSYKHLLELNAEVEKKARERALAAEAPEISFEELLAQEKSDAAFWQRHRKLTSISPK